jgi:hypothetical protein
MGRSSQSEFTNEWMVKTDAFLDQAFGEATATASGPIWLREAGSGGGRPHPGMHMRAASGGGSGGDGPWMGSAGP